MILAGDGSMQEWSQQLGQQRQQKIIEVLENASIDDPQNWLKSPKTFIGLTSSRLGHRPNVHWHVCRFLARSVMDCRRRDAVLVVAAGSAIEPWAIRAAELFDTTVVRLSTTCGPLKKESVEKSDAEIRVQHESSSFTHDQILVAIADRIDAVHVRRGGRISKALQSRLAKTSDGSVRVAVGPAWASKEFKSDSLALIQAGAVGWFDPGLRSIEPIQNAPKSTIFEIQSDWAKKSGEWLVHCTRAPTGPWPDQTINQYRDSMILGDDSVLNRKPIDSLGQILRSGRIVASSVATIKEHPVVCLTENSLLNTLSKRCFRPQLGRWDYEPFGVAVRMSTALAMGCEPVIYGQPGERSKLKPDQRFRFHPSGKTYDWQSEREWRCPRNLNLDDIASSDLRVFALRSTIAEKKLIDCRIPITWVDAKKATKGLHAPCQ